MTKYTTQAEADRCNAWIDWLYDAEEAKCDHNIVNVVESDYANSSTDHLRCTKCGYELLRANY